MSKYVVNSNDSERWAVGFGGFVKPKHSGGRKKVLVMTIAVAAILLAAASIGGYLYWRDLQATPQYSLALLIDAARRNDQSAMIELVQTDDVVDDFLPQITKKAVEIYGRGMTPQAIIRLEQAAAPLMPAIKDRARAELPRMIRQKTEKFADVPFAAMVVGADNYLDITLNGETAIVKSKLPRHTFEVEMRRNGAKWQIVGVRDDQLAERIALTLGQQIIGLASKMQDSRISDGNMDIKGLRDLVKMAEEFFK